MSASPDPEVRDDPLALFLADRDAPCPGCGYNVRGLASGCCPECRQRLILTVALAEPYAVRFTLAAIALSAWGAAFGLIALAVVVVSLIEGAFPPGLAGIVFFWGPLLCTALSAVLLWRFLSGRSRRHFARRSRGGQWAMVAIFAIFSVAVVVFWFGGASMVWR
jgi:hypothetical protein